MWELIKRLIHSRNKKWKMEHGYMHRGRKIVDGQAVGGEVMGGGVINVTTSLRARHFRKDPKTGKYGEVMEGRREVLNKKVTTAFVNFIVDQLITESSIFGDFKYHDSGTGVVAENPSDVGLGTPCGEARTVGSQEEGSQTYEYKSIATHTYAGTFDITEHGLFNASSGVTLMDRTVFTAIGVTSGDKIEFTFTIQFSAEA